MTTVVQHAIVKSIVSSDILVVKPLSLFSNENEQRISFNYITAPKLARPPVDTDISNRSSIDEPYAFECREFLRKKLVGQEICYTINFHVPQKNCSICTVYLGKDIETGENIIESLLSTGFVKLNQQVDTSFNDPEYERLVLIDKQAKKAKHGRYSNDPSNLHIRNMKWILDNPEEFFNIHKSSLPLDAIVEFIPNGNTVRCLLLPSYYLVTIQLTGIKCPMLKREGISDIEPFAEEAREYVETRLLQREVKVVLNGVNKQNLMGSLLQPNGDIALYLLNDGLAKLVDKNLSLLKGDWRGKYRAAEKFAKDNQLKIWQNYVMQSNLITTPKELSLQEFPAKVLEIVSGDALIIRNLNDNKIQKIYLSSILGPRSTNLQQIKRALHDIPYLFQARELLRKYLIDKTVRVIIDYIQPATDVYPEKNCCTIYIENINIGEVLISQGLAKVIRCKQDDEQRSSCYDDLLVAEQQAKKLAVGLFSNGDGLPYIIDMTGDNNKAKSLLTVPQRKHLLNTLQQNGRMEGVVEFVFSASRFRIHLLNNNWIISFVLSSINCPRAERHISVNNNSKQRQKIEPGEPFSIEALTFSKEHFLQRNVFVEVEHIDHHGNFIGRLITTDGQSAALMLVQAGLAKVHNAPNYQELLEAEEKCRSESIGIWSNSNSSESLVKENEDNTPENSFKY